MDLDALKIEVVAALGLGDAEEGHDRAPFRTVGSDPAMADMGHQVGDLMGDSPCNEGFGLVMGDLEVVADTAMPSPVHCLSSGLAGQVEADIDSFRGMLPGRPEEGPRLGEMLFGRGPQPVGEREAIQEARSRSMARKPISLR